MVIDRALRHFKLDEFKCPCCGQAKMDANFLVRLDQMRDQANVPFVINSGYRCREYNQSIDGASNSAHLRGRAADIRAIDSPTRFRVLESALAGGFTRIGVGSTFIHVDSDDTLPQCVSWTYD